MLELDPTHQHDQFCPLVGCHRGTQMAAIVPLAPLPALPVPLAGPSLWELLSGLSTEANLVYESSTDLCTRVASLCGQALTPAINLDTSLPGVPSPLSGGHRASITASPYHLLHAMGQTIRGQSILPPPLSRFSGHWAVVAYLSCFRPPAPPPTPIELRLSPYANALRGRQRAIWSEAMAIGVADFLTERSLEAGATVSQLLDVDGGWLKWAIDAKLVTHLEPKRRPDYLAVRYTPGGPEILAIECKGRNGARKSGIRGLANAMGQATSVGPAAFPVRHWSVAAACSRNNDGTWHPQVVEAISAPAAPLPDHDLATASRALERLQNAQLLEAIGDIRLAHRLLPLDERGAQEDPAMPSDRQRDDQGRGYLGWTLRITFGTHTLDVFLGIDEQIRTALTDGSVARAGALRRQRAVEVRERSEGALNGYVHVHQPDGGEASLSAQGTLLSIRAR